VDLLGRSGLGQFLSVSHCSAQLLLLTFCMDAHLLLLNLTNPTLLFFVLGIVATAVKRVLLNK